MMSTLQASLRQLVAKTPAGANQFADLLKQAHMRFFGTPLSESKNNAYCATVLGVKNANTFKGLSDDNCDAVKRTYNALAALCNRSEDHVYDTAYLDFFLPVFTRPASPGRTTSPNVEEASDAFRCQDCGAEWSLATPDSDVPEVCPYCLDESNDAFPLLHIGIWTTVEFEEDNAQIRITQTLRSYNDDVGEYNECVLAPTMNYGRGSRTALMGMHADDTVAYRPGYVSEEVLAQLRETGDPRFTSLVDDWETFTANPGAYNVKSVMARLLRAVQTQELERLVDAIGQPPHPEFTRHQSQLSLFDGYVPYHQL